MGIFNGSELALNITFLILIVISFMFFIPIFILMMERKNIAPLNRRNIGLLILNSLLSQTLALSVMIEFSFFATNLCCWWILMVQFYCVLLIVFIMSFRITDLWLMQNDQKNVLVKKKTSAAKKIQKILYRKNIWFRVGIFFIVFLIFYIPIVFMPLWQPEVLYISVKNVNFLYPMQVYCCILIFFIIIPFIVFLYKTYKIDDNLLLNFEFLLDGFGVLALLILYICFVFTNINFIVPVSCFSVIFFSYYHFGVSIAMPLIQSIINERKVMKGLRSNPKKRLEAVLESKEDRFFFRQHLMKEFSVENLEFYEAYSEFCREVDTSSNVKKKEMVDYIYHKFISKEADFQVNISENIIMKIDEMIGLGTLHPDIFKEAADEIFNLMATDSLSRFNPL